MNVKNVVLGIGIVVIYALMLWQGIEAFYPSPDYNEYCTGKQYYFPSFPEGSAVRGAEGANCTVSPTPQQQDMCIQQGGNLIADSYDANGCALTFTCDTCSVEFAEADKAYNKTIFFIALIIGIITLVVGYAILSVEPVGSALMASGVWAIFYGTVRNWSNFTSVWRFVLLLLALVLLVWIALRLNSKSKKGFFGFGKK